MRAGYEGSRETSLIEVERHPYDVVQTAIMVLAAASVMGGVFLFYGSTVREQDALSARLAVLEREVAHISDTLSTVSRAVEDIRIALVNKMDRR